VNDRDIVFFLGAGFSCDAGLKTMLGFGDESRRQLKSLTEDRNKRNITRVLLDAGQTFSDFQGYCRQNDRIKLNSDNMEEVFCVAEVLRQAKIVNIALGGKKITIDDLVLKIKLWLWKIYQQCPPLNRLRQSEIDIDGYKGIVSFIKKNNLASRITAITANYDLIFEYFLWESGINCCYPISGAASFAAGSRTESFISQSENDGGVLICKLHGSVNYFKTLKSNTFGICHDVTFPGDKIGESVIPPPKRPAIFALDSIWALRDRNPDLEPMIIPPTYAKLEQETWLVSTWNKAIGALRDAKVIFFIGYSMPETDGFIKAMLQAAFTLRKKSDKLHIHIVDPDKDNEVFGKYGKIFEWINRKDNFMKMKFSKAWSSSNLKDILHNFL